MKFSRRSFLQQASALTAANLLLPSFGRDWVFADEVGTAPHYFVLITLRGGFDPVLSLNAQDAGAVGDGIFCGYRPAERVQGSRRLFGPLIGGLERHDDRMCIVHGVRSDTTSHVDGLGMLARGRRSSRPEKISRILGGLVEGDAPLKNLDLVSGDGQPLVREAESPDWRELRSQTHLAHAREFADESARATISGGVRGAQHLGAFLSDANADAAELDQRFRGDLGANLRLAFQAIRGNWARCIQVASRGLWFDSHSDNLQFQRLRQPDTWADLATLVDLLADHRNEHGPLIDQTTIAVFSEIGRFPRLNAERGKDHFPENTWLLIGKGVRGGTTVGATDHRGMGMPVDYRSGTPNGEQSRPIFIDNTFASLVRIAGADPRLHGYGPDADMPCLLG